MPAPRPVISALRFCITAATIGTNGGELINATEVMVIESASTFNKRHKMACIKSDTKTAKSIYRTRLTPCAKSSFEKSAIEAMARLKMYIRYIPISKLRSNLRTGFKNEKTTPSVLNTRIKMTINHASSPVIPLRSISALTSGRGE